MVNNIDRYFLGSAIICALVAMAAGIAMGVKEDFTFVSAHAHLNLVGWVSLTLFALAYRSDIVVRDSLAVVHFFVATAGAIVLPIGIMLVVSYQQPIVAIVGSLLTIGSMLIFAANFLRQRKQPV